jgi:aminopeptidase N
MQMLLLGEAAPRDVATSFSRALAAETSSALVETLLGLGQTVAERWAPAEESPALLSAFADAAMAKAEDREHRQVALRALAGTASTDAHWAVLERAIDEATDTDLAWRAAVRRAELGQYDAAAVDALLASDPDPDAPMRHLAVLAASPDVETKEEVWRAFFVDYRVPASRETLVLGATFWRPGQADLLRPFAHRYLDELHDLKGGLLNQGLLIRAMFPLGAGDEEFLAAARAASADASLSAYARAQLKTNSFVLSRILTARAIA